MIITVRLIDWTYGQAAAGVPVCLERRDHDGWVNVTAGLTGSEGQVQHWALADNMPVIRGTYRLTFDTGSYFAGLGMTPFCQESALTFILTEPDDHIGFTVAISPSGYIAFAVNGVQE